MENKNFLESYWVAHGINRRAGTGCGKWAWIKVDLAARTQPRPCPRSCLVGTQCATAATGGWLQGCHQMPTPFVCDHHRLLGVFITLASRSRRPNGWVQHTGFSPVARTDDCFLSASTDRGVPLFLLRPRKGGSILKQKIGSGTG
jgi:hypothetical protein